MVRLTDGETRTIRPSDKDYKREFKVMAECVDSDTPVVHVTMKDRWSTPERQTVYQLTDSSADELCRQIQKALGYLPTSK